MPSDAGSESERGAAELERAHVREDERTREGEDAREASKPRLAEDKFRNTTTIRAPHAY
jgi:hypothetical protein